MADLTQSQRKVFDVLSAKPGEYVSEGELFDALYVDRPIEQWPDVGVVRVHISKLRQRIEGDGLWIEWRRNYGYRLRGGDTQPGAAET